MVLTPHSLQPHRSATQASSTTLQLLLSIDTHKQTQHSAMQSSNHRCAVTDLKICLRPVHVMLQCWQPLLCTTLLCTTLLCSPHQHYCTRTTAAKIPTTAVVLQTCVHQSTLHACWVHMMLFAATPECRELLVTNLAQTSTTHLPCLLYGVDPSLQTCDRVAAQCERRRD